MIMTSLNGYTISYDEYRQEKSHLTVIAMHGFGGDRTSRCIAKLQVCMQRHNVNLITFDWPAHGESETDGQSLRIENCLNDLKTVCDYVKEQDPEGSILAFATSFGAYITLLFQSMYPEILKGMILRAPAIRMDRILTENILDRATLSELQESGICSFGFERQMLLHREFLEDLKTNDLMQIYKSTTVRNIEIIQGDEDVTAPVEDTLEFCKMTQAKMHLIRGANHRFDKKGQVDEVIDIAEDIIGEKYLDIEEND